MITITRKTWLIIALIAMLMGVFLGRNVFLRRWLQVERQVARGTLNPSRFEARKSDDKSRSIDSNSPGRNRAPTITPDEARKLLQDSKARYLNIDERSKECAEIIRQLCLSGYTEEAWEMINNDPGQVRNFQLTSFFTNADIDSNNALMLMQNLQYRIDFPIALSAYLERLDLEQLSEFVSSSENKETINHLANSSYRNLLSNSLSGALGGRIAAANTTKQLAIVEMASMLYQQNTINQECLLEAISNATSLDSFSKFEMLSAAVKSDAIISEATDARNRIIETMVRNDAEKSLNTIAGVRGEQGIIDMQFALNQWTKIDTKAAADWYSSNINKLDKNQQDGASLAFFKSALDYKEYDTALQWSERIVNLELRNNAKAIIQNARQNK